LHKRLRGGFADQGLFPSSRTNSQISQPEPPILIILQKDKRIGALPSADSFLHA
jgi:hypothetical protein